MPIYLSYIVQPLNMVYFSPLKIKYSQYIQDLVCKRIYYINKKGFLLAFKYAFFNIFIYNNCKKVFKAFRLVPINIQVVINYFNIQLYTPLPAPLLEMLWQSKTLSGIYKFGL